MNVDDLQLNSHDLYTSVKNKSVRYKIFNLFSFLPMAMVISHSIQITLDKSS